MSADPKDARFRTSLAGINRPVKDTTEFLTNYGNKYDLGIGGMCLKRFFVKAWMDFFSYMTREM